MGNHSMVSPKFEITLSGHGHTFVITIVPKSYARCQAPRTFNKSKGRFGIRLKCESESQRPRLAFYFSINGNASPVQVNDFHEHCSFDVDHVWEGLHKLGKTEWDPE